MSRGNNGPQAFVVRSDKRLNINATRLPNGQRKEIEYAEEQSDVPEIPLIAEQEDSAPTAGWDDIGIHTNSSVSACNSARKLLKMSEYSRVQQNQPNFPRKKRSLCSEGNERNDSMDIDSAFFLVSAGMSLVTLEPVASLCARLRSPIQI